MMIKIFKRRFKNEYRKAINMKIAHPEQEILCPKCRKPLLYSEVGNAAEVKCPSRRCISGNSRGSYKFQ